MKKKLLACLTTVFLGLGLGMAEIDTAHAALLINGSFETPASSALGLVPGGSTQITGWKVLSAGIERIGGGIYTAQDGQLSIDLDPDVGLGGIQQTFATTPGASYFVSFFGATLTASGRDGIANIDVAVGSYSQSFYLSNPESSLVWMPFNFTFTATELSSIITFSNSEYLLQRFAFLDNVSVSPASVPEPATMLLLGLGLVGLAGVRRKLRD